eukprot:TRINITY_DN4103_c0_g2_i10.p1 TRINITY_DN4103_c0_g2~~TRINITY_DN4103_c0_g2_i10.p1  ORF type:complete len:405 (+),score=168.01 TRINITY_DN4103_c0_g2_i10:72-1217(+)
MKGFHFLLLFFSLAILVLLISAEEKAEDKPKVVITKASQTEAPATTEEKTDEEKKEGEEEEKLTPEEKRERHLHQVLKEKELRKFKLQKEREEQDLEEIKSEEKAKAQLTLLTASNFTETIKEGVWLIDFLTPSCEACKNLETVWARIHLQNLTDFKIASVDLNQDPTLGEKFNISRVPQIFLFKDGEVVGEFDKEAERSVSSFRSFVRQLSGVGSDPTVDVITITNNNKGELEHGEWLVGFFVPWCPHCSRLSDIWSTLATQTRGVVKVAKVLCDEAHAQLCESYQVEEYPTVRFINAKEKISLRFRTEHKPTTADFIKFLDTHLENSPYSENYKNMKQIKTEEELRLETCGAAGEEEEEEDEDVGATDERVEAIKKELV